MATVVVAIVQVRVERPEGLNDDQAQDVVADRLEAEVLKIEGVAYAEVGMTDIREA